MTAENSHPCVMAHGCSLGAYQAANMAFRHPHLFKKLAAFSGRYDLTHTVENFPNLFDGHYRENIYFNTPTHFRPNLNCPAALAHLRAMDIVPTIGKEDPFRDNNEHLSDILHGKGIPHAITPGQHSALRPCSNPPRNSTPPDTHCIRQRRIWRSTRWCRSRRA